MVICVDVKKHQRKKQGEEELNSLEKFGRVHRTQNKKLKKYRLETFKSF